MLRPGEKPSPRTDPDAAASAAPVENADMLRSIFWQSALASNSLLLWIVSNLPEYPLM